MQESREAVLQPLIAQGVAIKLDWWIEKLCVVLSARRWVTLPQSARRNILQGRSQKVLSGQRKEAGMIQTVMKSYMLLFQQAYF